MTERSPTEQSPTEQGPTEQGPTEQAPPVRSLTGVVRTAPITMRRQGHTPGGMS
jgi:hypothetical protein